MDKTEKAKQLLERAKELGLTVEFDSGLVLVKRVEAAEQEGQDAIITELARYLVDVRRLVQQRAICARSKGLIRQRIWSEHGQGTLVGASEDGTLSVSITAEFRRSNEEEVRRSPMSITANAESLLVLDEEEPAGASSPGSGDPKSEQPRKGFFDRLRGREDSVR